MRFSLLFAGLCFTAAPAMAQTANFLWIYPTEDGSAATFVNRPAGGGGAEGLMEFTRENFRGIGDTTITGSTCEVGGLFHYAADENVVTPETYDVIMRSYDAVAMGPDTSAGGIITNVTGLALPTNPGATNPRGGWILTDAFAAPVVVPCDQTYYAGVNLPANANWPATDGQSIWACYVDPVAAGGTVGQNPRALSPEHMWSIDSSVGTLGWTAMIAVMVDNPVVQLGGIDPNTNLNGGAALATDPSYGLNGLYPDINMPRMDGLTVRVKDSVDPAGFALFTLAFGWAPFPQPLGFPGAYQLDLANTTFIGGVPMVAGIGEFAVAMPGSIPASVIGTNAFFQGGVLGTSTRLGNATAVNF